MSLEERVLKLEERREQMDRELANISGKVTVIITMNVAILLAVAFLALKL